MKQNPYPKKPLIFVIDDDPVLRLLVKGCLEKAHFQVKEAPDGNQALDLLQNCRPDLILLDLCMPGIGGFETCKKIRLRPELKEVPILIITGMNDSETIHQAFDAGASDFITKPINFLLLLPRVHNLLRYTRTMKDLRASEEKYQNLSQEFSTLLDGIPDVLLLLSPDYEIIWANKGAVNHLVQYPTPLAGLKCHDLWYQCSRPCDDCPVARCFISGKTETQRKESPDGRHWGIKVFPLKDQNDHVEQVILLASDVTESVRLKEEAMRASHLASIGEMAAGVAHEINNPNGLFLLNLPLLAEIFDDSVPVLEAHALENEDFKLANLGFRRVKEMIPRILKDMQNGANHIKHIVEDLRNFSPKQESSLDEVIDINEAVSASLRLMKNPIKKATDNLVVDLGENLPRIQGCFQRIEQIIINLVQNACQALNGRDKTISVRTFTPPDGSKVALEVSDQGGGIQEDLLSHITDPFFTTRRNDGGTGLGLSISARIIEEHDGKLSISSKPGQGSTFTVEFPAHQEG